MKKIIDFILRNRYFILVVLILILFNALSTSLFRGWRLDMSPTNSFSLSSKSKSLVSGLEDPVRIKLFFSKNIPAPYDRIEKYLREILWQYKSYAGGNFTYEFFDIDPTKEGADKSSQMAMQEGIFPVSVQEIENGSLKMVQVYMGMSVHYGTLAETIPAFQSMDLLELQITNLLDRVVTYQKKMQNIDHKIEVALYLPKTFVQSSSLLGIKDLGGVSDKVSQAVLENNKKSFDKLEFKVYDAYENDEHVMSWLDAIGVNKIVWGNQRNGQKNTSQAAVVIKNGENTAVYELLEPSIVFAGGQLQRTYQVKDLEGIETKIYSLVNSVLKVKQQIAYLEDKGASSLHSPRQNMLGGGGNESEDSLSNFYVEASKTYEIIPIKVKDLMSVSTKTLIISGIKEPLTDAELFQIDQFLMKGGKLILFYAPSDLAPPDQSKQEIALVKNSSGLDRLLKAYGVSFEEGMVLDRRSYEAILPNNFGQQEKRKLTYVPHLMDESINHDYRPFKNTHEFFLAKVGSIKLDENKLKSVGIQAKRLLMSSPEAWVTNNLREEEPSAEEKKEVKSLAVLLKGRFHSYFDNKDAAANIPQVSGDFIKVANNSGSIFILSSATPLMNVFFSSQQQELISAFMNVVDDLGGDAAWSDLRDKINLYPPVKPYDESASVLKRFFTSRTNLEVFNAFIIPLGSVLIGFYMMIRRKKYRKNIDKL